MKNGNKVLVFITGILAFSCSLNELPKDSASKDTVFNTEEGLSLYANSFYQILPGGEDIFLGDNMSDYVTGTSINDYIRPNSYDARVATGWTWTQLRNINFFLESIETSTVSQSTKANYKGIARFFRAYFYFEKVKRFGDVPWINRAMSNTDEELFNPRDSRVLVMDSILADIDFAIANIQQEIDPSHTLITKSVAYALKSRICLFEGSFRKYHTGLSLSGTADFWFSQSAEAARSLINEGNYNIYTASGEDNSYRALFISKSPVVPEIILSYVCDADLKITTAANRRYVSPTYGIRPSLTRKFINTYLSLDGTPFTDDPNYKTMPFELEVAGRDKRLAQTIRLGDYMRTAQGVPEVAPPDFRTVYTGYQPIKWCFDEKFPYDDESRNDNAISIIRYAEVLLNYAEAKAELGTFTAEDWSMTIGELRGRGGISGAAVLPTLADEYIQQEYFPDISDPVLLEVRRERGIELVLEGFRFYDLVRWRAGSLMNVDYNGIYVEALDMPMDLNSDGVFDVVFYSTDAPPEFEDSEAYKKLVFIKVGGEEKYTLSDNDRGELMWNPGDKLFEEKHYLYPIPQYDIDVNNNLTQNIGW